MIWRILGDVLTAIVIVVITCVVGAVGAFIYAIHKHMMKD